MTVYLVCDVYDDFVIASFDNFHDAYSYVIHSCLDCYITRKEDVYDVEDFKFGC